MTLVNTDLVEFIEDAIHNVVCEQGKGNYTCTCVMSVFHQEDSHVYPKADQERTLECEEGSNRPRILGLTVTAGYEE